MTMPLLEIKNLTVAFDTSAGPFLAVNGIDLHVEPREVLAIVGESGSGKSVVDAGGDGPAAWTARPSPPTDDASTASTC